MNGHFHARVKLFSAKEQVLLL